MIGFLNVHKPTGITSHDVVNRVRKIAGLKQVGHGGTLDPLAEGVMVVALGKATRLLRFVRDDKTYLAGIRLGLSTDTDDIEGREIKSTECSYITESQVRDSLSRLSGKQLQIPPVYSAIKTGGEKLYNLARRGEAPQNLEGRSVEIFSIEVIDVSIPEVRVRVHCSKGTYIRSLARDLGNMLSVGGCLSSLVREHSGPFSLDTAQTIEELNVLKEESKLETVIRRIDEVLDLPILDLERETAKKLAFGQKIERKTLESEIQTAVDAETYLVRLDNSPVMLLSRAESELYKPEVVLVDAAAI